jgi:putative transposase
MSDNGKRRRWSAADKLRIVLAGLQPGVEVADLGRREGLNPVQFYAWKKQLLEASKDFFSDGRGHRKQDEEELVARLYQEIGQLKVELDWLKKKVGAFE